MVIEMKKIEKFYWLLNKDFGPGIPLITFARYIGCNLSTLSRMVHGRQEISDRMYDKILNSVDAVYTDIKKVMEEEES